MDVKLLRDAQLKIADALTFVEAVCDDEKEKVDNTKVELLKEAITTLGIADTQIELVILEGGPNGIV